MSLRRKRYWGTDFPEFLPDDWYETEDGTWYNEATGEESPTDPRKKAKKASKKSKAPAPAAEADEEVAAAPKGDKAITS